MRMSIIFSRLEVYAYEHYRSGLHRTYISDIECFQRNVSLESIQKIAAALSIEAYMLLKEE